MTALNDTISRLAGALARAAEHGSLERRAAGCVTVAHATTRTPEHALRVLREHFAGCGNSTLLEACERLIGELTEQARREVET